MFKNGQRLFGCILTLSLGLSFSSFAIASGELSQERILQIAQKYKLKAEDLGLKATVGEGATAQTIVELNATKKMIPASITKIATASAFLDAVPPGTKLKTRLMSEAAIKQGVLKGDIYLKGAGDPGFVSENMWFLVNSFLRSGVKVIEGDIVIDDSLFDSQRYDQSRQKERVDRAYDAPVGAMSFNWNSVNIFVRPGDKVGDPVRVFIDPENDYIKLENRATTVAGAGNGLMADRIDIAKGDIIRVSGKLGLRSPEVVVFKNITSPDLWAGTQLKFFMQQRGLQVKGKIRSGKTPSGAVVLGESESKPTELMVADMNKFSNNYVAEMLTKLMASMSGKENASLADGMKLIEEHLKNVGVPDKEFELYNPSGLTRDNLMSANAVWILLKHLRNDFRVQPEFLSSLPIAGIDGTLRRRMKNGPAERGVRAKTGFLTGKISLAGYAGREDGQVMTFAFIYNGSGDETKVRAFFDEVLESWVK